MIVFRSSTWIIRGILRLFQHPTSNIQHNAHPGSPYIGSTQLFLMKLPSHIYLSIGSFHSLNAYQNSTILHNATLLPRTKSKNQQSNNPSQSSPKTDFSWKENKIKVAISGWRELALVPNHSKPVSFRSDETIPVTVFKCFPFLSTARSVFEGVHTRNLSSPSSPLDL